MVRTEARDHVLLIAMNRPDKRNAIDQQMAGELSAAFGTFDADPVFRVAVLTGTSRVFSAGTDMKEPRSPATPDGGEYGLVRRERRKPVIAAVEGVAFGGGFELVLACNLVVASSTASSACPRSNAAWSPHAGRSSAVRVPCPGRWPSGCSSPATPSVPTPPFDTACWMR